MSQNGSFFFDRFELRPFARALLAGNQPVPLGARAFDILLALLQRAGHTLSKRELLDSVWPDMVVEEANLQKQVCTLRGVLGDGIIATIPRRGYRLIAPVRFVAQADTERVSGGELNTDVGADRGDQHALARALSDPQTSVMLIVIDGRSRLPPDLANLLSAVLSARPQTPVLLPNGSRLSHFTP